MHLELDFETNGWKKNRIAAASFALVHDWKPIIEFSCLVRPDGWKMEEGASAANGLTDATLEALGLPIEVVFTMFHHALSFAEPLIVAHSVGYDLDRCLLPELENCSKGGAIHLADELHRTFSRLPRFCTMAAMRDVCKLPNPGGKKGHKAPKLEEAYRHCFGRKLENAHEAGADRRACGEIYRWIKVGNWMPHIVAQESAGVATDTLDAFDERALRELGPEYRRMKIGESVAADDRILFSGPDGLGAMVSEVWIWGHQFGPLRIDHPATFPSYTKRAPADSQKCEGCGAPATVQDTEGTPLCKVCAELPD